MQEYTLKSDKNARGYPAGTKCYEFKGHDYGCAREDTHGTGVPWISMTLNANGTGPFFTAPWSERDPKPEGHYVPMGKSL